MTHPTWRWLTLALAAATCVQAQEAKSSVRTWPIELQLGLDSQAYASNDARGPAGSFTVAADPRLVPHLRFSVEPFCIPKGRLQFSLGYRVGGKIEVSNFPNAELKDKGGVEGGMLYLFPPIANHLEIGLGADLRAEAIEGTGVGTPTKQPYYKGYYRGVVRYNFPSNGDRTFFVALEGWMPFSKPKVDDVTYYQDYSILTNSYPAGPMPLTPASISLTNGHFPTGAIGLAVGMRWGGYTKPCGGPVMPPPPPPPPAVEPPPPPPPVAPPPPPEPPKAEPVIEKPAVVEAPKAPEIKEVEGLVVRFPINSAKKSKQALEIVRAWARVNKDVLNANLLTVTGHCDESGGRAFNEKLSVRRAQSVAEALRQEGIQVDESQVSGKCWDVPEVPNTTDENRAKNRRGVVTVKDGAPFKVVRFQETPVIIHVSKRKAKKEE